MTNLEKKFVKIYANIPLGVREEIVAIVDEQPLTFYDIYHLIEEKNPMAIAALKQMQRLEII